MKTSDRYGRRKLKPHQMNCRVSVERSIKKGGRGHQRIKIMTWAMHVPRGNFSLNGERLYLLNVIRY